MSLAFKSTLPSASMVEPTVRSLSATLMFMLPPERMAEPVLVTLSDSCSLVSTRRTSTVFLLLAEACALALASALPSTDASTLADWPDLEADALVPAFPLALAEASALALASFSVEAYKPKRAVTSLNSRFSMF